MDEEHGHLLHQRVVRAHGLFCGSWHADDDVSEDVGGDSGELALLHGERQNVRGLVFIAIGFVQLMDLIIVNKYD